MKNFLLFTITIGIMFISCKQECDKNDPNSNCYEPPPIDQCIEIKKTYANLLADFKIDKDSCLVFFLSKCFLIDGYVGMYNYYLNGSTLIEDSLRTPEIMVQQIGSNIDMLTELQKKDVLGAARTGLRALDKKEVATQFYDMNIQCLE